MAFSDFFGKRRLFALILVTIAIQVVAVLLAIYLRNNVSQPIGREIAAKDASNFASSDEGLERLREAYSDGDDEEESFTIQTPELSIPLQEVTLSPTPAGTPVVVEAPKVSATPLPEKLSEPAKIVVHKIQTGETLSRIWMQYKAGIKGANEAAKAFKKAGISLNTLRPGEEIELQLSTAGEITAFKKQLKGGKYLFLEGDSKNGYTARIVESAAASVEKTVAGSIHSSFSNAALEYNIPYELVDDLVDLFSHKLEFRKDIQPGDTFTVVYDAKELADGSTVEFGKIKAASIVNSGRLMAVIRYTDSRGESRYFDEQGTLVGSYFLRYPVQFSRISSVFTDNRLHPVLKVWRAHEGVDFAAPAGTPVRAVANGVVTFAKRSGGAGNMVKIQHGSRYATEYLHLKNFAKGLYAGAQVQRGQIIGSVGSSGLATGPHLDFRFRINGNFVNPLTIKLPHSDEGQEKIPGQLLLAMLEKLKKSHDVLQFAAVKSASKSSKLS